MPQGQITHTPVVATDRDPLPTPCVNPVFAPIFAVPEGIADFRPIYDARFLNRFIRYREFKLERLLVARDLTRESDFF